MKILMINSVCGVRSTGRICTGIADVAAKDGNICKIAYGRASVPEEYEKYAVRIGSNADVYLHGLKARMRDASGLGSVHATKRFIEWVREYDPDVIHLHNLHGYYIDIPVLFDYLRSCGKKIVWTLHDCWSFTGHCAHFTMAGCGKWMTECYSCPEYRAYPRAVVDRSRAMYSLKKELFSGLESLTLVTPSYWLEGLVKQSFLKNYPVQVINNGIDLSIFHPRESGFRERYGIGDKYILLGVSFGWDKRKGLDVFAELAKRLDERFQIVLVGTDKGSDAELPPGIISIHRTDDQLQLAELYSAADIFINPTREDNFPTVNLEALACGTPVITFDTGGSPECIDESCGSVVPCGDVDALEAEIKHVAAESPYAEKACIKRAVYFDMRDKFEDYIRLYLQVSAGCDQ